MPLTTRSKPIFIFFIFLPLLVFGVAHLVFVKSPLTLFPDIPGDSSVEYVSYTDRDNQGTSIVKEFKKGDDEIMLRYMEGDGFAYPFVGINLAHFDTSRYWNLSEYDHMKIQLSSSAGKIIPITLGLNVNHYSKVKNPLTFRSMVKEINLSKDTSEYILPLNAFTTPAWWYSLHEGFNEETVGKPDFSKCRFIAIQSCNLIKPGVEDRLGIQRIQFYKDYSSFYAGSGIIILLYYFAGVLFIFYKRNKSNEVKPISIQYQSVLTENRFNVETQKIITCITDLYADPELDLDKVQRETGISKTRISDLLKESLDLNFRQFLNHLRTNEAKKMLCETDRQVSEIAYLVGYGNVSHFNRVFKSLVELSPIDYRKKHLDRNTK